MTVAETPTPTVRPLRNYEWSEMEVDPLDLIGRPARIEVTHTPVTDSWTEELHQWIHSGVIRDIIEDRGPGKTDEEAVTPLDKAENATFEEWGKVTIHTDNAKIVFGQYDRVIITIRE